MLDEIKNWAKDFFKDTRDKIVATDEKVSYLFEKKESNHQNPYLYFSAGLSLNDKDRDNNHDSTEIQKFFKPIDNLFGDYEIRKKFGFHNQIYRLNFFDRTSKKIVDFDNEKEFQELKLIDLESRADFRLYLEEDGKVKDEYKAKDFLLLIVLIYDLENKDSFVECFKTTAIKLHNRKTGEIHKILENKIGTKARVNQVFVLDPEKLIHAAELDKARQDYFREALCINEGIIDIKKLDNVLKEYLEVKYAKEGVYPKAYNKEINNFDIFSFNKYDNEKESEEYKIVDFFRKRMYKLKNFEAHEYFRIRIGYEENHYVLFLHPYESESNNPVRFPPPAE